MGKVLCIVLRFPNLGFRGSKNLQVIHVKFEGSQFVVAMIMHTLELVAMVGSCLKILAGGAIDLR